MLRILPSMSKVSDELMSYESLIVRICRNHGRQAGHLQVLRARRLRCRAVDFLTRQALRVVALAAIIVCIPLYVICAFALYLENEPERG